MQRELIIRNRPLKGIVRELHVSRNTVRKVVRSGATALSCKREVQPLPRLGPWRADLDRLLLIHAEAVKASGSATSLRPTALAPTASGEPDDGTPADPRHHG
jgi:hypothetical protein